MIPALFLAFNRPVETEQSLKSIGAMRLSKLYVVIDGPRPGNSADEKLCAQVLEIVSRASFPFPLLLEVRPTNMGASVGVAKALADFFSIEPFGLVIEDDCLVEPTFVDFAEHVRNIYSPGRAVFAVTASNYVPENLLRDYQYSYWSSTYFITGAWATWAEHWLGHPRELGFRFTSSYFVKILTDCRLNGWMKSFWLQKLLMTAGRAHKSAWSYQLSLYALAMRQVTLVPSKNMCSNIGFNTRGTNTRFENEALGNLASHPAPDSIVPPDDLRPEGSAVKWFEHEVLRVPKSWPEFTSRLKIFISKKIVKLRYMG